MPTTPAVGHQVEPLQPQAPPGTTRALHLEPPSLTIITEVDH